ncbi:MAG: fumarylacetoacetate hydrolase family protein [Chitinophagaceae bacterium]|nr:fumarylacetoacetate hydrolase family protein [Chitinophagaceae bacterium]
MKIICIGRNYAAHAAELHNEIPEAPVLFMKPQNALLTDGKPFYHPDFSKDIHYECELVLRICKNGKYVDEKFAHKYFDAITVGIDFTARDLQDYQKSKGLPWEIAKAFDHSAVVGTFIPLTEEDKKKDWHFSLSKNTEVVQQADSSLMLHNFSKIISYASQFFSFNIGDLIFTGTPKGVGSIAIGDCYEGFLEGEKRMEVKIC